MPRLLDLFCGAGGAGVGYSRAGFDVEGVDITPQPRYPFPFIQADALEYLAEHGHEYDVIHASPPCQEYSSSRYLRDANQSKLGYKVTTRPKLIAPVREALVSTGRLWIIENVPGSPLPSAIQLCGSMFGLPLRRHRWFEASVLLFAPQSCRHTDSFYNVIGGKTRGYGKVSSGKHYLSATGERRRRESYPGKRFGQMAMGIDWMTLAEMSEAIPPAYTEWLGRQLMNVLVGAHNVECKTNHNG